MSSKLKCVFKCDADNPEKVHKFNEETFKNCLHARRIRVKLNLKYSDIFLPDQLAQLDNDSGYHAGCRKNFTSIPKKYINMYEERRKKSQSVDPDDASAGVLGKSNN